jgi:predicted HTH domain antitoxin
MKKYFFENCDKAISQANFSASKLCEIQIPVPEKKTELMKVSEPIKSQLQAINQLPASILNDVFGQYQIILTSIERGYDEGLREWKIHKVLAMYKNQEITLWKAAELAGVSLGELLSELPRQKIVFQYDSEELREDLEYARSK